ncbi:hypothetical protein [Chromobacterium sp. IIBBL 290-4]|uniref:hypothetical protein n=1 Tax=Chromobacterium sp. IIBBL 290-4 TaxID=2953890 RepID=UPI0020B7EDD2|nr:hypothetical protein [Chromobacterium sp. IIBBL 290-4]UTH76643.1 hypothetical protein NKT35_11300 [Chromobacterium sp. IIBBL 290-4]
MSIAPIAATGPQALSPVTFHNARAAAASQTVSAASAPVQDQVSISSAGRARQQEEAAESAAQAAQEAASGQS